MDTRLGYVYTSVYVYVHHSCVDVAGFERSTVDDLRPVVLCVSYLDSSVNLHLALNLNNGFQSIKDLLNLATIKLSVLAIGSGQIETSNPIHMKVNNEVYDFGAQEFQYGMLKTPLWGGAVDLPQSMQSHASGILSYVHFERLP